MSEAPAQAEDLLYKVTAPRTDWTFYPSPFWRTEDWSSSTHDLNHRPPGDRAAYIEDSVLYAGRFDEINIHLLPKVWRLRVRLDDAAQSERLRNLGFTHRIDARAVIFALAIDRRTIESFSPTIYAFAREGFEPTPSNEFISRAPCIALSCETLTFGEAMRRWDFDLIYVSDAQSLVESLRSARVDHQVQT